MNHQYRQPASLAEAFDLLRQHGAKARLIAGGTDLMVQLKHPADTIDCLVDISGIPGFDGIQYDENDGLCIGALTTIRDIEQSPIVRQHYTALAQAASLLGSVAIRNVATIGGNICNASPSAETAPALVGYDAAVTINCADSERAVSLEDFFTGPGGSVCTAAEVVTHVTLPPPGQRRGVYLKHSRTAVDLATTSVAVVLKLDADNICHDARIVLGAVAPTPLLARAAASLLLGKEATGELLARVALAAAAAARPISDVRASADYRREMVRVLTLRALRTLLAGSTTPEVTPR